MKKPSQSEIILAVLSENVGRFVSMPFLVAKSGAYAVHSRISDLRTKGGHNIKNEAKNERGQKGSFYMLIEDGDDKAAESKAWIEQLHPVVGSFAEREWDDYCSEHEGDLLDIVAERHCDEFYSRFEKWLEDLKKGNS